MKYFIVGTAGHVDHGKTTLIEALTGTNTDRLKEEKERGISIDLGFACLKLNENIEAGIVDVPGHERFLKNMLAGSGSIDAVMLVVAADEGVMPQTREHLAMLALYGIKQGIIVLNKVDSVDEEWLSLVKEDVQKEVQGTFLQTAPFCLVSALKGTGINELRRELVAVLEKTIERDEAEPMRLWIDRVFTIKGHGTVVTGSLLGGSVKANDQLLLLPTQKTVKVRGVQNHFQNSEVVRAGQRTAINLAGVEKEELKRGMLLTQTGYGVVSQSWYAVFLKEEKILGDKEDFNHKKDLHAMRVRVHLGTGEYLARIFIMEKNLQKEDQGILVRLDFEEDIVGFLGERAIIRNYSPQNLLGGLRLISDSDCFVLKKTKPFLLKEACLKGEALEIVYALLLEKKNLLEKNEIIRQSGYFKESTIELVLNKLLEKDMIVLIKKYYLAKAVLLKTEQAIKDCLNDFHSQNKTYAGLNSKELKQKTEEKLQISFSEKKWENLLLFWLEKEFLAMNIGCVTLKEQARQFILWFEKWLVDCQSVLEKIDFEGVDNQWLKVNCSGVVNARELLQYKGLLYRMGDKYLSTMAVDKLKKIVHKLVEKEAKENQKAGISLAVLRDEMNISRKLALSLLELLDSLEFTKREGDLRILC